MIQEKINRINELAKKAKTPEGLTEAELNERDILRKEYIASFRKSLEQQLDNVYILEPDGTERKLIKTEEPQ